MKQTFPFIKKEEKRNPNLVFNLKLWGNLNWSSFDKCETRKLQIRQNKININRKYLKLRKNYKTSQLDCYLLIIKKKFLGYV